MCPLNDTCSGHLTIALSRGEAEAGGEERREVPLGVDGPNGNKLHMSLSDKLFLMLVMDAVQLQLRYPALLDLPEMDVERVTLALVGGMLTVAQRHLATCADTSEGLDIQQYGR